MRRQNYCLLFSLSIFLQIDVFAQNHAKAVHLKPGMDVNASVQKEPPGTTFILAPGLYRMQSIVPKANDIFRGNGKVILDGAEVLNMIPEDGMWSAAAVRVKGGMGHCTQDHPLCWALNDLFIDDEIQVPVENATMLGPGKWFYDDKTGKAVISTDPTGHKVEYGKSVYAFSGTAEGVKISGLTVERYANPSQRGVIGSGDNAPSWDLSKVEVGWNHGAGVELGQHAHVADCYIHHNGQLGIGTHGADDVVEHNEVAYNNYAGYRPGWEAGGSKFSRTDHLTVRANYFHDNGGAGIWSDIDNIHSLYENNVVVNNSGAGIEHEISYDAVVRNNILRGNHPAILLGESPNVEVYGNTIQVPHKEEGIIIRHMEKRGMGAYGPRTAHDDHIYKNVTIYLGEEGLSGLGTEGLDAEGDPAVGPHGETAVVQSTSSAIGNTFDQNQYFIPAGGDRHWTWNGPKTISEMHALGQEVHSTVSNTSPALPGLNASQVPR
jgi:hypothetical protein